MTILVVVGWILTLCGLTATLIMQVWVQPKWFREDNARQAKLITDRFDAQLETVKLISQNAADTLTKASEFFILAEHRFGAVESRLDNAEHLIREQNKVLHKAVVDLTDTRERVACIEAVCTRQHETTLRTEIERRRPDTDEDLDLSGVPRKRGC